VRSWSGTYQAYGGQPITMPGDIFHFIGYGSPDDDIAGHAGLRYEGDALCTRVVISWDWRAGAMIGYTTTFAGHLDLSKLVGADPGDNTPPNLLETSCTKIQYGLNNVAAAIEIPNLTNATLTFSCAVEAYVNSSTCIGGIPWTGQKGGPIDWGVTMGQQDTERLSGIFDIDNIVQLKLFIDATKFWELKYGIVRDFSGITHNRETGAIIARTVNVDMNAYYGSTNGFIKLPDLTQWWPF